MNFITRTINAVMVDLTRLKHALWVTLKRTGYSKTLVQRLIHTHMTIKQAHFFVKTPITTFTFVNL